MMKRIVSLTLVVLMVAALFVGCGGGDSNPVGTYSFKSINGKSLEDYFADYKDQAEAAGMDFDALLALMGIDLSHPEEFMKLELMEGGKLTLTAKMSVAEETKEGTWELNGDKLTMTVDGDPQECTFKNGEITMTMDGENGTETIVLAK